MSTSSMSLARAFTRRNKRSIDASSVQRGTSVKYAPGTINRSLISLPTELLSTTNVQALTAPDIRSISGSTIATSASGNDSDFSTIDRSFLTNAGSDTSSIAESNGPATPITPASDDLRSFFDPKQPVPSLPAIIPSTPLDTPMIPQRSPSRSKKSSEVLIGSKSAQRMSPPPTTLNKPAKDNSNIFTKSADPNHPFGKELAQVNEIAEEFGVTGRLLYEEEQDLINQGLCKFGVEEYLDEIAELYGGILEDQLTSLAKPWI